MAEKVIFAWSGGKDSAMALYELQKSDNYDISALLTTVSTDYNRVCMHGVRNALLERQAEVLGFSLEKVYVKSSPSNKEYEARMKDALISCRNNGVSSVAFGDIFLEDLRKYREDNLSKVGLKGIFPLWKLNTSDLARNFIGLGFKAVISCVDSKYLDKTFVGRNFDSQFLSDLPAGVDPCGENGEFHSFVFGGPMFPKDILYKKGEILLRENRFYYCDLIPGNQILN